MIVAKYVLAPYLKPSYNEKRGTRGTLGGVCFAF